MTAWRGRLAAGAIFALGARQWLLRSLAREAWAAQNHAGRPVDLVNGPAFVSAVTAGAVCSRGPFRQVVATVVAVGGSAALGHYDDVCGDPPGQPAPKGLRGHLLEVRAGRLSSGAVKGLGLPLVGVAAATFGAARPGRGRLILDGCLVAGSANLLNLLDRQPGRASKAALLLGAPALALPAVRRSPGFVTGIGAVAALLPADLAERGMLGDCGANALGALLGQCALRLPWPVKSGLLGAIAGLTLHSERSSFSARIERTPVLRRIDQWGRVGSR